MDVYFANVIYIKYQIAIFLRSNSEIYFWGMLSFSSCSNFWDLISSSIFFCWASWSLIFLPSSNLFLEPCLSFSSLSAIYLRSSSACFLICYSLSCPSFNSISLSYFCVKIILWNSSLSCFACSCNLCSFSNCCYLLASNNSELIFSCYFLILLH